MLAAYVRVALDAEAVVRVRRLAVGVGAVVAFEDLAGTRMLPRKAAVLRETPRARALAGPGRRAALARLLGTDTFVRRGLAIARLGITVDEIFAATRMRPVTPAFAGPARRAGTPYTLGGDVLDRDLSTGEVYDLKNRQNYPSNRTAIKR